MELCKDNIFDYIQNLSFEIDEIISSSEFDRVRIKNVLYSYQKITSYLITIELFEDVRNFIIAGQDMAEAQLPKEYESLKKIYELHSFVKQYCENKIKTSSDCFEKYDYLGFALEINPNNVYLFNYVIEEYEKLELHKELISVYKLMFFYLLNPIYFEKIGDLYYKMEEWNNALDAYLTCAESSEEYAEIYKKLADVFEKINDNDSRLACLEHARTIEGANGL